MKFLFIILLITSCSSRFKKNDCFVDKREGGYFKVLKIHEHSYIAKTFGTYKSKISDIEPMVVPIDIKYARIDCFEGEFKESYLSELDKLIKEKK